jgi:proteasome lid subunit RPN8/RPN11
MHGLFGVAAWPQCRYRRVMSVKLASPAIETMIAAAGAAHPHEACGLLLGDNATITAARTTANVAAQPETHFEIDPAALIAAHRVARAQGARVIGYFHSHPNGRATPSPTDRAMAAHDGRIWAIVTLPPRTEPGTISAPFVAITLWRDAPSGFEPLSYVVVDG